MVVDINLCIYCKYCAGNTCLERNVPISEMNGKECGIFEEDESFYEDDK